MTTPRLPPVPVIEPSPSTIRTADGRLVTGKYVGKQLTTEMVWEDIVEIDDVFHYGELVKPESSALEQCPCCRW